MYVCFFLSLGVAQIFQIMEYVQSTLSLSVSCRLDTTRSGMYRSLDGCPSHCFFLLTIRFLHHLVTLLTGRDVSRVSQPWY